jgi:ATP-dependent Lon protease
MVNVESFAPRYPLLALKNIVVFPQSTTKIHVGRPRSLDAIEEAMERDHYLVASALRDPNLEEPTPSDVYDIGTLCRIKEADREQGGTIQVSLEGLCRVRIMGTEATKPCYFVSVEEMYEQAGFEQENRAWARQVRELLGRYAKMRGASATDLVDAANAASDVGHLADVLAVLVQDARERQGLLEEPNKLKRLEHLSVVLTNELEVVDLEQKIKDRVREQIDKNQREYYLREQLKAIHDELGETTANDVEALKQRIAERGLPDEVKERALRELARLERMPGVSAEATVVRTYLDWILGLPWAERSTDRIDLQVAQEVLDADHYSLDHVKERILDFLAVRKLVTERGVSRRVPTILCFVGPPGIGKTSLGRSIARAMDRQFVRVSLGGVRDEADIRGHRRTYVGAFPGRIIHAVKQAGTMNPVILLDEIDKMSSDFRGDPAAAMLEVLDPEQNHAFVDHYLDVPYDLSEVMFITTGNYLGNIPRPLRDRMEVIEIGGYTEEEKIEICRRHLIPRQAETHGLDADFVEMPAAVIRNMVRLYTREAGVRSLERQVATVCRKAARIAVGQNGKAPKKLRVTPAKLEEFLGPPRFGTDHALRENHVGVAIGLCVSEVAGGDLLPVEVATMPGHGNMTITGRAGDVMQESARAAQSYARSRAQALKIDAEFQRTTDVHIHLPEGATPKDGPSAGVTMVTALVSALTKRPVRNDVAMTGEITLRGRIMPIGGLKEKTLAAHRAGIRRVIAPAENKSDAVKIPKDILRDMEMIWVEHMDEVIAAALVFDTPPALPESEPIVGEDVQESVRPEPVPVDIKQDVVISSDEAP